MEDQPPLLSYKDLDLPVKKKSLGSACNQWSIAQPDHIQEKEAHHHKNKLASVLGEHCVGFSHGRQVNAQGLGEAHGVVLG